MACFIAPDGDAFEVAMGAQLGLEEGFLIGAVHVETADAASKPDAEEVALKQVEFAIGSDVRARYEERVAARDGKSDVQIIAVAVDGKR